MLEECFYCKRYDICWDLKDNNSRCYSCAKKDDPKEIEDFWNRNGVECESICPICKCIDKTPHCFCDKTCLVLDCLFCSCRDRDHWKEERENWKQ